MSKKTCAWCGHDIGEDSHHHGFCGVGCRHHYEEWIGQRNNDRHKALGAWRTAPSAQWKVPPVPADLRL